MSAKTKPKPAANGKPAPPPPDVLTPAQAAMFLQVSEAVVLREAAAGRLPGRDVGGEWRFLRAALADWLRAAPADARPQTWKDRIREVIGVWKDDPTVDAMVEEIYRQRRANPVGGK